MDGRRYLFLGGGLIFGVKERNTDSGRAKIPIPSLAYDSARVHCFRANGARHGVAVLAFYGCGSIMEKRRSQ